MKDYFFGFATLAFVIAIGGVFWQLLSVESRPLAAPSASISDGGSVLHQQNLEAGQQEQIALQETQIALDQTKVALLKPTAAATKAPTSTPRATGVVVTCGEWLSLGTICELPKATPTKAAPPTQTPLAICPQTTPTTFGRDYCIWQGTPTPTWNPLEDV